MKWLAVGAELIVAVLSYVLGVIGGLLNETSNALGLLSNYLWDADKGRPEWMR